MLVFGICGADAGTPGVADGTVDGTATRGGTDRGIHRAVPLQGDQVETGAEPYQDAGQDGDGEGGRSEHGAYTFPFSPSTPQREDSGRGTGTWEGLRRFAGV